MGNQNTLEKEKEKQLKILKEWEDSQKFEEIQNKYREESEKKFKEECERVYKLDRQLREEKCKQLEVGQGFYHKNSHLKRISAEKSSIYVKRALEKTIETCETCFRCGKILLKLSKNYEFICQNPECGILVLDDNIENLEIDDHHWVIDYTTQYCRMSSEKYSEKYCEAEKNGFKIHHDCPRCKSPTYLLHSKGGFSGSNFSIELIFICSNKECALYGSMNDSN